MPNNVIDIYGCGHVFNDRHINFLPKEFEYKIFDLDKKDIIINGKKYVVNDLNSPKSNIASIFTPPHIRKSIFKLYNLNLNQIFIEKPVFMTSEDIISFEKNIGKNVKIFDGYIRNSFNHFILLKNLIKDQNIKKISFFEQKKWSTESIPSYLNDFKSKLSIAEVLPHYLSMIFSLCSEIKIVIKKVINPNIYTSKIIFEVINCNQIKEIEVIMSMNYQGLSGSILETSENNYYIPLDSTNKIYLLNNFKLKIGELENYFYLSNEIENVDLIVKKLWDNFKEHKQPSRDFEFHKKIGLILEELLN